MALNPSSASAAVAIQKDRDTPATEPTFRIGLTGGNPFGIDRSVSTTAVACGTSAPTDAYVESIEFNGSIQSLCYPDAFGLFLLGAMGKVDSSAAEGKDGYYEHVFTLADATPYLTAWGQLDTAVGRVDGAKVGTLEITATGNERLGMSASIMGIGGAIGLASIPGSAQASCYGGKFMATDCVFKLDTASDKPADALVSEATFTIERNLSGLTSLGRAMPRDISNGRFNFGVSVTTIPDDIELYQKMVTGAANKTEISSSVVYGSVYSKFVSTDDPNMTLEIEVGSIPFTADFPEADPEGSEATIQFSSDSAIQTQAGVSPATITLVNKVEGYDPKA